MLKRIAVCMMCEGGKVSKAGAVKLAVLLIRWLCTKEMKKKKNAQPA